MNGYDALQVWEWTNNSNGTFGRRAARNTESFKNEVSGWQAILELQQEVREFKKRA